MEASPMTARSLRIVPGLLLALSLLLAPTRSFAQDEDASQVDSDPLKADFKGMVGLGLIGAELGFVVPALAGARDAWFYIVFPVLGAGGGAVGGYFLLEKGDGHPEAAVAVLTAGMALAIPALVVTLAATAYDPETEAPAMAKNARDRRLAAAAGPGLFRVSERGLLLAPPAISNGPTVSQREALRTGVTRANSTRVALVSGVF
jgi:hypothetical protein